MESLKMSDVFNLPAKQNESRHFGNVVYTVPDDKVILSADSCGLAKYAVHAINNHDRLVEENAELREMVKSLKSAADEVTKYKHALSYNESYAGEPMGEIKNNLAELDMVSCKAIQLLAKHK